MLPPVAYVAKRYRNGTVEMEGIFKNVVQFFMENLNLPYEFVCLKKTYHSIAHRLPNGTWTDLLEDTSRGDVDLYIGPTMLSQEVHEDFVPLPPFHYDRVSMLASVGKSSIRSFFSFLFTIDPTIWWILALAFPVTIVISAWGETSERKYNFKIMESLYNIFWIYIAAGFCEGSVRTVYSRSSQVLLAIWLLSVLILSNCVVSQFKAALVEKENEDMLNSIEDILHRPHLLPVFPKNTPYDVAFRGSHLEVHREIYSRALQNSDKCLKTFTEAVSARHYQEVKDGKTIFFASATLTKCILSSLCLSLTGERMLYFLETDFFPHSYTMVVSKHVPKEITERIIKEMYKLNESALLNVWWAENYKDIWKCFLKDGNVQDPGLGFKHMYSVFYLLLACHALSTAVLAVEITFKVKV